MRKSSKQFLFLIISSVLWKFGGTLYEPETYLKSTHIISYYGYPSEVHIASTEDGYSIAVHRIPKQGGKPILLVHGFPYASYCWILNKPNNSLAFLLADDGYDVWMINLRGTSYSQLNNLTTKDQEKFWDFDWDQHGLYDVPAVIDYVIKQTENNKIYLLSHSMGSTSTFITFSGRPEYNNKIKGWVALAPVTNLEGLGSPAYLVLLPTFPAFDIILRLLGKYYFFPLNHPGFLICRRFPLICRLYNFLLEGGESRHFDLHQIGAIYSHYPDVDSSRITEHYRQILFSKKFAAYDFGKDRNQKEYNSASPPEYDLKKITVKTVLINGGKDKIGTPQQVKSTSKLLPNLQKVITINTFNNGDFCFAKDYKTAVYGQIANSLKQF